MKAPGVETPAAQSLRCIDEAALAALAERARQSPRRRMNLNLHPSPDAVVNRLANAVQPESYIRTHRHTRRWELLLPLRGAFDVLFFDDEGRLLQRHRLGGPQGLSVLEYPAGTWHTLVARSPDSVFFEVKEGPYEPLDPEELAPWSPPEGDPQAAQCLAFYSAARPGDRFRPTRPT
jgi:cupin fold WbuC family metalloprotein